MWCPPWWLSECAIAQVAAVPSAGFKEMLYGIVTLAAVMAAREITWWIGRARDSFGKKPSNGHGALQDLQEEVAKGAALQQAIVSTMSEQTKTLDRLEEELRTMRDHLVAIRERMKGL